MKIGMMLLANEVMSPTKKSNTYTKKIEDLDDAGEYRDGTHKIEIPIDQQNESNYDCHFLIGELPEELEGHFECLGENTEKYSVFLVTFSVPIQTENGNDKPTLGYNLTG